MDGFIVFFVIISILAFYFIPTIIAFGRGKGNKMAILALNLFLGWSVIGWIVSLVWALAKDVIDLKQAS